MNTEYKEIKNLLQRRNFQDSIAEFKKKFKGKKVLLYGAGLFTRVVLDNYSLDGLNIIGVSDMKFKGGEKFYGYSGISLSDIADFKPDVILISAYRDTQIKYFLKENHPELRKIPKEPILKRTLKDKIHVVREILGSY